MLINKYIKQKQNLVSSLKVTSCKFTTYSVRSIIKLPVQFLPESQGKNITFNSVFHLHMR